MKPLRLAIAGLTHDHVGWLLNKPERPGIEIVGIAEPDPSLIERAVERSGLDRSLFYPDLETLLTKAKPEAVAAFGTIFEHREVVAACAPRGVHVMVEKPLAVSGTHATEMASLARQHNIHLLTNYETTWYPSVHAIRRRAVEQKRYGTVRKVFIQDGHWGPVEIGCSPAFLDWLTDPVLNGGGAVIDFGCYGANLLTWLLDGAVPERVTAVTRTFKPETYPKVDDDSTIIVDYPETQGIILGSWVWPFGRKDLELYGTHGYSHAVGGRTLKVRERGDSEEQTVLLDPLRAPAHDPFSYLAAVVRGTISVAPTDLCALENNLTVVRILDAARESAATGRTVALA